MAENITFDINAKDNASATLAKVSNNLGKMQKNVQATSTAFEKFRNALIAVGAVNLIRTSLQYADAIQDISDATNIATASVIGFSNAVAQNGGNAEKAQQGILKLVENIGDAANGSAKAQKAFADVGVTLEDLRTLSEQEILEKTIKGLAGISDYSKRAAVQTELLGKSLKGVNVTGVANNLNAATAEGAKYAASIKSAAETQQALENSITNLKIALLDVLKPLADVLKDLTASIETIKNVIKVLLILGAAVASMTLLGRAAALLAGAFRTVAGAAEAIQAGLLNVSIRLGNLGKVGQFLSDKLAALSIYFSNLITKSPKLAAAIEYLAAVFTPLVGAIAAAATGFGLFESEAEKSQKIVDEMNKQSAAAHAESTRQAEEKKKQYRAVQDALDKQKLEIQQVTKAYKENNDQFIRNINSEAMYLQMSNDAVEIAKAQQEIYDRAIAQITELQNKKASLSEGEKDLISVIDEQIAAIEKSIMTDQFRAENAVKNIQAIKQAQEDLRKSIEDASRAMARDEALVQLNEELSLLGLYGEELEKQQAILSADRDLRKEMQALAIDMLNLEAQRTQLGEETYQKERSRITQQMLDAQMLRDARIKAFEEEQAKKQEIEQSYAEGAKRALNDIADQYKPINMAQDAIQKGWSSISNAIDTFTQTGKFKFKDFARSVLADLAAMIAKALVFKAISGFLGGIGLPIPGLAKGGPAKAGEPYIVGEKGPELFVPQNSGTVVPNNKLGMGSAAQQQPIINNYTYNNNINAVDAKSVAALFYENRKALFGATNQARKEMPYGAAM